MTDASVKFQSGLNVVTGPSDTGKSLIGEAIDYVFGASTILREVPEKQAYTRIFVSVSALDGTTYTLERSWEGGAVRIYESDIDSIDDNTASSILATKHAAGRNDTVSAFLLRLCGLSDKLVRRNARGTTRTVSFRDTAKLIFVTEDRIFSKSSPVLSGQFSERTVDESFFKLLLTGNDDQSVVEGKSTAIRRAETAGKKELIQRLIDETSIRVAVLSEGFDELRVRAQAIDSSVTDASVALSGFTARISELDIERRALSGDVQRIGARTSQVFELLSRFELLDKHYTSDLQRLSAISETGHLFNQLDEGPCPICGAPMDTHAHDGAISSQEVALVNEACAAEMNKVHTLRSDLSKTVQGLDAERLNLDQANTTISQRLSEIESELADILQPRIGSLRHNLSNLVGARREIERGLALYEELSRLQEQQQEIEARPTKSPQKREPKGPFASLEIEQLCQQIERLLGDWKYPDLQRVTFDDSTMDLRISGRPRATQGKGYRAVTYAAFSVGLMQVSAEAQRGHPGFVILDSPLVTYRKKDVPAGEEIEDDIVPAFYENLLALSESMQVIVLENEEPTTTQLPRMNYIHFTGNDFGRSGLLLLGKS
ncbi:MAG: hypothetical protein EON58_03095 [Alphaproteobacteria bacterium]|nr:MAG: hypothetical protein EON58_03095 [Alphaproteobacteria bacterium]